MSDTLSIGRGTRLWDAYLLQT